MSSVQRKNSLPDFACSCLNVKLRVEKKLQGSEPFVDSNRSSIGFHGGLSDSMHELIIQPTLRDSATTDKTGGRVNGVAYEVADFRVPKNKPQLLRDPFLADGNCQVLKVSVKSSEISVFVRYPALVAQRLVATSKEGVESGGKPTNGNAEEGYVIGRCLLCDSDVWGHESVSELAESAKSPADENHGRIFRLKSGSQVLIGQKLLKPEKIGRAMESAEFSEAIGLAWPKNRESLGILSLDTGDNNKEMNKNGSTNSSSDSSIEDGRLMEQGIDGRGFSGKIAQTEAAQQIMTACAEYLRREQEAMDIRVKSFIEKEAAEFEAKRKRAKAERDLLLRELESKTVTLGDIVGRSERQNSGGSANDSAVPLSPISLASLEQSPGAIFNGIGGPRSPRGILNQRVMGQPEESGHLCGDEDLFSFDEDHVTGFAGSRTDANGLPQTPGYPADDEADAETDDSGTGEDYSKYYPPYSEKRHHKDNKSASTTAGKSSHHGTTVNSGDRRESGQRTAAVNTGLIFGAGKPTKGVGPLAAFGTSMPVKIPNKFWPPKDAEDSMRPSEASSSDEENDEFLLHRAVVNKRRGTTGSGYVGAGRRPQDMAASIRALAASVQAADDPERLFGEFPQRRRYRTGDAVRMRVAAGSGNPRRRDVFPDVVGQ